MNDRTHIPRRRLGGATVLAGLAAVLVVAHVGLVLRNFSVRVFEVRCPKCWRDVILCVREPCGGEWSNPGYGTGEDG